MVAHSRADARFEPDHGHWPCHGAPKVDSACYLQWDGEWSTGLGWAYVGTVASVRWQVKLCDPIRRISGKFVGPVIPKTVKFGDPRLSLS